MKKIALCLLLIPLLAASSAAFSVTVNVKPAFGIRIPVYSDMEKAAHIAWVSQTDDTRVIGIDKHLGFYRIRTARGVEGYIESFAIDPVNEREIYKKVVLALYEDRKGHISSIDRTRKGSPLRIIDAYLSWDQGNIPRLIIEYHNVGEKEISEFAIMIYCYDGEGRAVRKEGGDNIMHGGSRGLGLTPDGIGKSSWSLKDYPSTRGYLLKIYEVKFVDGTAWPEAAEQR